MKRNLITIAAVLALATTAHAGGIGIGNTYNTTNNTTNNKGGDGGTGVGVGVASSKSTATAGAAAGAVSNSGGNKLTNEGNNSAQSTSVKVEGDVYEAPKVPVATAYAAPLTASNGTCMGSTSAGAQGVTIGVSVGTTWTDSDCDRRYDAQELRAQGHVKAATALMCQKPSIAAAMKEAGTPCPSGAKTAAAPAQANVAQVEYTDPIIRRRLGLPPL